MRDIISFLIKLIYSIFSRSKRFIRINFKKKGKIFFYDKINKKFFYVWSRHKVDSSTIDQIFTHHEYDFTKISRFHNIRNLYQNNISNGHKNLILDCGSNIGCSSIYFNIEFPCAKIVGIEPDFYNYKIAIKNCKKYKNISIMNEAIGPKSGFVKIINKNSDPNSYICSIIENSNDSLNIKMNSINKLLKLNFDLKPFIIKVDIEGFENELFGKNLEWIESTPVIIIELHDWLFPKKANSSNFLKEIAKRNRDFVILGENIISISNKI